MVTNKRKLFVLEQRGPTVTKGRPEDDVDALFRLPLAEFTGARNALAAQLKKSGRGDEAARVKALVKPSVSAWAVNQLYWNHRDEFDQLIASGERFHKAQTSGKVPNMREAIDARREVLTLLSGLATTVLRDAGHSPSPDTIHRVTTTLEGISAYAQSADAPHPGRLSHDIDPPGFELFGSSSLSVSIERHKAVGGRPVAKKSLSEGITHTRDKKRQIEETRKANIATARATLQEAKRSLTDSRARSKSLEAIQKKALASAKEAERQRGDAEERLEKAEAALKEATRRARSVAVEVEEALKEARDASSEVEEAARDLEKLFGE